jgi:YfiH family protein
MPFQQSAGIRYLTFDSLRLPGLTHAVFTRQGGVSEGPYAELNVGATVGDERPHVLENLERVFAAIDRPRNSIFDSWLVHGTDVLVADAPRPVEWARPPKADVVLTNKPEVTLFMRYADCVPIILYDPKQRAVGLAHAGWRGTVAQVTAHALEAMNTQYGTSAADVCAVIGPAISTEKYQVGPEVLAEVQAAFGDEAAKLLPKQNGSTYFDLVGANEATLRKAGVQQIERADLCTASNQQDWFSHRGSGGRTGRFGALIALT